ncbi:hypothetical protein OKW22_000888 [Bacilli bacterium PM5-3]|nr:hypothetical protein [Bacilli bacterium PM5-3]
MCDNSIYKGEYYGYRESILEKAKEQSKSHKEGKSKNIHDIISLLKSKKIEGVNPENIFSISEHIIDSKLISLEDDFKKEYDDYFGESNEDNSNKYHYVWIAMSEEDFVIVVGKTSFSKKARSQYGDLFNSYNFLNSVTQHTIFEEISTEDEKRFLKSLHHKINNYIKRAIIIPISSNGIDFVNNIEKDIGRYLIDKEIPILNVESHEK